MTAFGGDNAESFYDEGLTASMKGDMKAAISYFQKAARADSTMATAYHQLGKCYARLGDPEKALGFLSEVVKKRPKLVTARLDLAGILVQLNQIDSARQHFQAILQADPENGKALLGMARADFQEGHWQEALSHAQAAQVHGGANFANAFMLAKAAKLSGDRALAQRNLEKADKLVEKYQELNAEKPEGHYLRGEVAFVLEDFPAALAYYRAAEETSQADLVYQAYGETFSLVDILAKQGLCLQRLGEKERASEVGKRIAGLDPSHPLGRALRDTPEEDSP